MIVARGAVEIAAYEARIQHGNINNAMLIDRVLERANYDLAVVLSAAFCAARDVADDIAARLREDAI